MQRALSVCQSERENEDGREEVDAVLASVGVGVAMSNGLTTTTTRSIRSLPRHVRSVCVCVVLAGCNKREQKEKHQKAGTQNAGTQRENGA